MSGLNEWAKKNKIIEQNWKRNQQSLLILHFGDSGCTRNQSLDLMWRLWKHDNPPRSRCPTIYCQSRHTWMSLCFKPKSSNHNTPWKINMEHNNGGLEDDIFKLVIFRFHVNFPGCNFPITTSVVCKVAQLLPRLRWLVQAPHLHHFHFSLDIMAGHLGLVQKLSTMLKETLNPTSSFPSSFATVNISSPKV